VNESSDTGQASIVFLGRESFRMQVVDGAADGTTVGAIPTAFWEGPTARIIERRNFDRRTGRRIGQADATPAPTPATVPVPARNMIIGISLLTFACGVAVATAANRLPRSASARIAQIERRQAAMQPPAPPPAATTAPAAMIIQPLGQPPEPPEPAAALEATAAPEPAAATAPTPAMVSSPIAEPRPAKQPAMATAKATPTPRTVAARVAPRPRRPTPSGPVRASDLEADDPFGAPPPRTPAPRKWVDPFAE
jgi:hypothetical protein